MIISLEGNIKLKGVGFVVLDISGVGYKVFVSAKTINDVSSVGKKVLFWTHLYVRENAMELYGFLNYPELQFFEQLISISGIGPKGGLSVLDVASLDILKRAISAGETSYLTKVSGIGNKLAEKIVLELKDKVSVIGVEADSDMFKEEGDALEALRALGYSLHESRAAIRNVSKNTKGTENIVKEALQNINKK